MQKEEDTPMTTPERIDKLAKRLSAQETMIQQLTQAVQQLTQAFNESQNCQKPAIEERADREYPNTREGVMDNIMDNFDFKAVADLCKQVDWRVYDGKGSLDMSDDHMIQVDEEWLRKDAVEKIHHVWEAFDSGQATDEWIEHSGPLKLWWCECDEGIFAELTFVAEEWRVEPA